MLTLVTAFCFCLPTTEEAQVAQYEWKHNTAYNREYDSKSRIFKDSFQVGGQKWTCIHDTKAYNKCLYVIQGKRFFFYDHTQPWDGIEAEIRR